MATEVPAGSTTGDPSAVSTAEPFAGKVIVTAVESGTITAPAPTTFWMPLENETGRLPGNGNVRSAPSTVVVPSGWPTVVPFGTVMVVPSGSVSGVPAVSAI